MAAMAVMAIVLGTMMMINQNCGFPLNLQTNPSVTIPELSFHTEKFNTDSSTSSALHGQFMRINEY
jgi:hypothetical protein